MSTIRDDGFTIKSGMGPDGDGTMRGNGSDIGSGYSSAGTAHAGADIRSGMQGPSNGSSGMTLNNGDSLVINSVTYRYEGVISKSSGEAEIFLLSRDGMKCVFKLYYPNFKPKDDILRKLVQLNHQDIINVLDYGYHHDRFFEIMDYAEGGTLDKHLPIKDINRIKQITTETVNAYQFCHNHGIIHKDIKPQNLYFKNADGTDLLIGDFGISSMLDTGMSRHLTSQSLTVGYAAPEMYGLGGKVYIGKEVDYYALGITLIHIWDGKSPYEGLGIHAISNLTTSGKVHIPEDMHKDVQKLVRGLITLDYSKRWGYDEVQRWLLGEDVPVHFQVQEINYPPYQFGPNEAATTPEELAKFLNENRDRGKKQLYSNKISAWVNLFNQGLSAELDRIVEDDYPKDQDAGIQKAIYVLAPDEGFTALDGTLCFSSEQLGDELEKNKEQYKKDLVAYQNQYFYLYLEAHEAKNEADTFRKYFKTFSAEKAINTIIVELQGRERIKHNGEWYINPDELLTCAQIHDVISALKDTESKISLWIEASNSYIKLQVDKWRSIGQFNETTLTYALEKGSPFHFNNNDKAYTTDEFESYVAKMVQGDHFSLADILPNSTFYQNANYWLENYANAGKDYFDDAFIVRNIQNSVDSKKALALLKDYFNKDVSIAFCKQNLLPIIQKAIDDKVIKAEQVKNYGNESYFSTWFMRWHFLPDMGIKVGNEVAKTPKELAELIDKTEQNREVGKNMLRDQWIKTWLEATGNLIDPTEYAKATSTESLAGDLESLLHLLDPSLSWPKPQASPSMVNMGYIYNDSEGKSTVVISNAGRGFLFGSVTIGDPLRAHFNNSIRVGKFLVNGDPLTVTVSAKPSALPYGSIQRETMTVHTNGGTLTVPISYRVGAPIGGMLFKSLACGLILGAIFGFLRTLGMSQQPNLIPWIDFSAAERGNSETLTIYVIMALMLIATIYLYVLFIKNNAK